jgi:hypothetical protein
MTEYRASDYEATEAGRDMYIDSETTEMYESLTENSDSPFEGVSRKRLFVFALGYGWRNGVRTPFEGGHELFNRPNLTEQQRWLIRSIAMAEEQHPFCIRDESLMFTIAQEYANAGIRELYSMYNQPGDGFVELSTEISRMVDD